VVKAQDKLMASGKGLLDDRENAIPSNHSLEYNKHSYETHPVIPSSASHKLLKEEMKHTLPTSSIEKRTVHRSSASSSGIQNYL
jgi:hypothetical protein